MKDGYSRHTVMNRLSAQAFFKLPPRTSPQETFLKVNKRPAHFRHLPSLGVPSLSEKGVLNRKLPLEGGRLFEIIYIL